MTKSKTVKTSKAGSVFLMGLGLVIAIVGCITIYYLWHSYSQAKLTRTWQETPCLIIESEERQRSAKHITTEYSWSVLYVYDFDGKSYSSKFHTPRAAKWSSKKVKVDELLEKYPVGEETVCYVDSQKPSRAILKHDTLAAVYTLWFPGIFVVGGFGLMYASSKGLRTTKC